MKKLFITTFVLFYWYSIFAQSYKPLPDSMAKWCILYNNHIIPPPIHAYTNYWETYYSGDTSILGLEYKKIERTEYDIFCLSQVVNGPEYLGALRDDAINKKVFFIPNGETNEELIYDFNLVAGDTLFSYLNWYEPLIVELTDSILIGDEYHKSILFKYGEAEIIEGIGSRTGIIEELVAFEGGSYLCALYVDTLFAFPENACNLSYTDTCLYLNISRNNFNFQIDIYPNPANSFCQIIIPEELLFEKLKLEIINSMGVVCKTCQLVSLSNKISLENIPDGLYFFTISDSDKLLYSQKVIKK